MHDHDQIIVEGTGRACPGSIQHVANIESKVYFSGSDQGDGADPVFDPISKASHYNSHPANIECIDVIEWFPCNIANAIKYLWRHGLKGGEDTAVQDLRKAAYYCNREADRLEKMKS